MIELTHPRPLDEQCYGHLLLLFPYHGSASCRKTTPVSPWNSPPLSVQDVRIMRKNKRERKKTNKQKRQALETHPPPCPLEELFNRNNCQIISCHHPLHCPLQITALLSHQSILHGPAWPSLEPPIPRGPEVSQCPPGHVQEPCVPSAPSSIIALESHADTAKCEPAGIAAAGHIVFRSGPGRIKTKCVMWAGWNELQMKLELAGSTGLGC